MNSSKDFNEFAKKMTTANMDPRVIELFGSLYSRLKSGDLGTIREDVLGPVSYGSLPRLKDMKPLQADAPGMQELLAKTAMIKLNGGLGTSMGLSAPKSFLPVRGENRFIDITANQVLHLRETTGVELPLIFMNSAVTKEQTTEFLEQNPKLGHSSVPQQFVHHSFPKVVANDFSAANRPDDPGKEWNPAGHGDIYTALNISGTLDKLAEAGIEYLFISNIDNLGATLDLTILDYMAKNNLPFIMEVCRRREMDKKGGHLAKDASSGRLVLRERAQAADEDIPAFEDIEKYSYFNSNSIWISVPALRALMKEKGTLELPLIANKKHLVPTDKQSPEVYQIESAMGAAMGLFDGAQALEIPQTRFRPVKKYDDLLLLWSDRFELSKAWELEESTGCTPSISVSLDPEFFGQFEDFNRRIGQHVPGLKQCESLTIKGDVHFTGPVDLKGSVEYTAPAGETLEVN